MSHIVNKPHLRRPAPGAAVDLVPSRRRLVLGSAAAAVVAMGGLTDVKAQTGEQTHAQTHAQTHELKHAQACPQTHPQTHPPHLAPTPDSRSAEDADPLIKTLQVAGAQLEVQFAPGLDHRLQRLALTWVRRSAQTVAGYFGRFPVTHVVLLVVPVDGGGVRAGTTFGEPELMIRLRLGRGTSQAQLRDDWILVHEMVHLALPRVAPAHNWLHEGVATYVESVARARAGWLTAATVWRGWMASMPKGQPQEGDAGLDHTPSWGRTYWGGAIFCLRADVQMLTRSAGRVGLRQALQGVLAAGGHFGLAWPVDRILATADAAVRQTTLTDLYQQLKASPQPTDLDALWRSLGVMDSGFDDAAPLAAVRRAILS